MMLLDINKFEYYVFPPNSAIKCENNAHKFDKTILFFLVGISLGRGHPLVSGMEMKYRITSITPRIARMR